MDRHRLSVCLALAMVLALVGAVSAEGRTAHRSRHRQHHAAPRQILELPEAFVAILTENAAALESEENGSVATAFEVAFPPEFAGFGLHITARGLFGKCKVFPHLAWLDAGGGLLALGPAVSDVELNEEGVAVVVLLGVEGCQSGSGLIEATLEEPPYTEVTTEFTVLPPTPEPEEP